MTCHGDSSFPLIAVPCEEDSDFLVTTTCVMVVLKGKLLELEVDVERDDEGLEPDNDVSEVFSVSFSSISSKKGFFGFGGMAGAPSDCRKGLAFGILVLGAGFGFSLGLTASSFFVGKSIIISPSLLEFRLGSVLARVGGGGLGGRGLGEFGFVAFCMAGCKLFPDSDGCLVAEVLEKASSVVPNGVEVAVVKILHY